MAGPRIASAQPAAVPVIGFLHSGSPDPVAKRLAAWHKGLQDGGFVEGRTVAIEYRWASGRNDALPGLVAELIQRRVDVIATPASTPAAVAAGRATTTIPIVFATGADPIALGLVDNLSRPGRNVTGVVSLNNELAGKRLGLFRELIPGLARIVTVINPSSVLAEPFGQELQAAAAPLGLAVDIRRATTDRELEAAFGNLAQQRGNGVVMGPDAFFFTRRAQIAAMAARLGVPVIFDDREYAEAGGLAAYGANWMPLMALAGGYTARVLKGEKPADLPVAQSSAFELVINLKAAKALGIAVPPSVLAAADEVIE